MCLSISLRERSKQTGHPFTFIGVPVDGTMHHTYSLRLSFRVPLRWVA
jgi:hypothetical protein